MSYDKAVEAAEYIRSRYERPLTAAIVLGSGLGSFADSIEDPVQIPFKDVPHFAESTVEGHAGKLVIGKIDGVDVIAQQGRFHFYEGYEMDKVVLPVRAFGQIGIKTLILTN